MELFEKSIQLLISGLVIILTILKINGLSVKSSDKILKDFDVLKKAKELGINTTNIEKIITKNIEGKYPDIKIPRKRNWWIISISFILSCLIYWSLMFGTLIENGITFWLYFQLFIFIISFSIFITAIFNRE